MEINIYAGILLAELNTDYGANATSLISWPWSTLMIVFGLFLASFPEGNPSWMPWSRAVEAVGQALVPNGGEVNRHVVSLGATIFMFGIFFSRNARRLLSQPFLNFLGRISFPIYLLHNTLIRTVLSWVLYWQSIVSKGLRPVDEEGKTVVYEVPGGFTFAIVMPLFYLTLIYVSYLWTIHVDPRCERVVSWLSKKAFGDTSDSESSKEHSSNGILAA
jgi:hypothetical protein